MSDYAESSHQQFYVTCTACQQGVTSICRLGRKKFAKMSSSLAVALPDPLSLSAVVFLASVCSCLFILTPHCVEQDNGTTGLTIPSFCGRMLIQRHQISREISHSKGRQVGRLELHEKSGIWLPCPKGFPARLGVGKTASEQAKFPAW